MLLVWLGLGFPRLAAWGLAAHQIGLDWIKSDRIGSDRIALDWIRSDQIGLDWIFESLAALDPCLGSLEGSEPRQCMTCQALTCNLDILKMRLREVHGSRNISCCGLADAKPMLDQRLRSCLLRLPMRVSAKCDKSECGTGMMWSQDSAPSLWLPCTAP